MDKEKGTPATIVVTPVAITAKSEFGEEDKEK